MADRQRLFARLRELIAARLEGHGGLVMSAGKKLILEFGCSYSEEAIAITHEAWQSLAKAIDIPLVPEESEQSIENAIWARIEVGLRAFIAKVCDPAKAPTFDTLAMADDTRLPNVDGTLPGSTQMA